MKYIKFKEEKQKYRVIAENDQFMICVKPFNPKKTYLYSIVDKKRCVRGPDNSVFGPAYDYNNESECEEALKMLMVGRDAWGMKTGLEEDDKYPLCWLDISQRRMCDLNVEWIRSSAHPMFRHKPIENVVIDISISASSE